MAVLLNSGTCAQTKREILKPELSNVCRVLALPHALINYHLHI